MQHHKQSILFLYSYSIAFRTLERGEGTSRMAIKIWVWRAIVSESRHSIIARIQKGHARWHSRATHVADLFIPALAGLEACSSPESQRQAADAGFHREDGTTPCTQLIKITSFIDALNTLRFGDAMTLDPTSVLAGWYQHNCY
jgi:hypothetical protein